jgi:hypothetical protein
MEFELVLNGADWIRELEASENPKAAASSETPEKMALRPAEPTLNLALEVARSRHLASHPIVRRTQQ